MSAFSLCVYCGARPGTAPAYLSAATELGGAIAGAGMRLVYGAGDVGLMGAVARAAQAKGAQTFGVIPTHLMDMEVGKTDLSTFVVTETMHERKKVMFMNADAVVVLPGGAGSLDEFFEAVTWRQLGLHEKPIFLLNVNGYWNPLRALMAHVVREGFADETLLSFVETVEDVPTLMARLQEQITA